MCAPPAGPGLISTQYLVKEPIARAQLATANNRIQALGGSSHNAVTH